VNVHELKTETEPFEDLWVGNKTHEVRSNVDRTFCVGDLLYLREWDPYRRTYSGAVVVAAITYISKGGTWGLPKDRDILSIKRLARMRKQYASGPEGVISTMANALGVAGEMVV
jgi:hypothetical protein